MQDIRVTQLNIYPIKSTSGQSCEETVVERMGLQNDRRYMLVNEQGKFLSGRQYPSLTQVSATMNDAGIQVTAALMPTILIPFDRPVSAKQTVTIWRDQCCAYYLDRDYDQWFSDYLKIHCHLVAIADSGARKVDQAYGNIEDEVSFADGFPVLLISEASLLALNQRLAEPVEMSRFRPNIVITGCEAHAEDQWQEFRIGKILFRGVKNCSRCIMTTINPSTGQKHPAGEPLKTLSQYRKRPGGIFFGQNLIPLSIGTLRVGDQVQRIQVENS